MLQSKTFFRPSALPERALGGTAKARKAPGVATPGAFLFVGFSGSARRLQGFGLDDGGAGAGS